MVQLRYVYILCCGGEYFSGSTNSPEKVIEAFRKNNPNACFQVVCAMGFKDAQRASRFLRRMKPVDYKYWSKHSALVQAGWICKAAGLSNFLANDYSAEFNK